MRRSKPAVGASVVTRAGVIPGGDDASVSTAMSPPSAPSPSWYGPGVVAIAVTAISSVGAVALSPSRIDMLDAGFGTHSVPPMSSKTQCFAVTTSLGATSVPVQSCVVPVGRVWITATTAASVDGEPLTSVATFCAGGGAVQATTPSTTAGTSRGATPRAETGADPPVGERIGLERMGWQSTPSASIARSDSRAEWFAQRAQSSSCARPPPGRFE